MAASRVRVISVPRSENAVLAARVLTAALVVLSSIALFSIPLGEYDDSLVLIGARLISAGELPYLDFYTHYGPFGYTFVGLLIRLTGSPALALRCAEAGLLAGLAILTHVTVRRVAGDPAQGESTVPLVVIVFSAAALFPSFPGFAFAAAALELFILALKRPSRFGGYVLAATAGASLSLAALTRPAFGAYVTAALLALTVLPPGSLKGSECLMRGAILLAGALITTVILWLLLYRHTPIRTAFDALVLSPAHLTSGGDRYLEPDFMRRGAAAAIVSGVAIAGMSLAWGLAIPSRLARTRAAVCLLTAGLLPFLLRYCVRPGVPLPFLGLLLFPMPALLAVLERRSLREHADLAFAAAFGVGAAAFGHYFWVRADAPHLLPSLAFGSCGAALISGRFARLGKVAVLVLLLAGYDVAARNWHLPIFPITRLFAENKVRASGSPGSLTTKTPFGCENVPEDAARAVSLADKEAASDSRFVAIASSHVSTQGNPVLLFVLSSRLPYTKWFQYDPGLQSSPPIQREMERELLASGSRTAVVWRADRFVFDQRTTPTDEISSFDEFVSRLYPVSIGRFGEYEVRVASRSGSGAFP